MPKEQKLEYHDGDVTLEGFYAYDDAIQEKKPAVLVFHDWSGRNDFACRKAEKLMELGYVGFAVDLYGKGKTGKTKDEKVALMQPLMQDRGLLRQRIEKAFEAVKTLDVVDVKRIGAIGFCFGGLCALDLARSGLDVKGIVSFHGLLGAPENLSSPPIKAKVLALHGFDDPMVTPDQITQFGEEMTHARVDWQIHVYGNTMHAFTNPEANDPGFGTVYHADADKRSWIAMKNFFAEIF